MTLLSQLGSTLFFEAEEDCVMKIVHSERSEGISVFLEEVCLLCGFLTMSPDALGLTFLSV